jgi:hypothetical protein
MELSRLHAKSDGHGSDHLRLAHRHPKVNTLTAINAPSTITSVFKFGPFLAQIRCFSAANLTQLKQLGLRLDRFQGSTFRCATKVVAHVSARTRLSEVLNAPASQDAGASH